MSGTTNKHTLQLLNELNELKQKQLQMKQEASKINTRKKSFISGNNNSTTEDFPFYQVGVGNRNVFESHPQNLLGRKSLNESNKLQRVQSTHSNMTIGSNRSNEQNRTNKPNGSIETYAGRNDYNSLLDTGKNTRNVLLENPLQKSIKRKVPDSNQIQRKSSNILLENLQANKELKVYRPASAKLLPSNQIYPTESEVINTRSTQQQNQIRPASGQIRSNNNSQWNNLQNRPSSAQVSRPSAVKQQIRPPSAHRRIVNPSRNSDAQQQRDRPESRIKDRPIVKSEMQIQQQNNQSRYTRQSNQKQEKLSNDQPKYSYFDPNSLFTNDNRRLSINIEEKANEIIRDTDNKILSESARSSPKRSNRSTANPKLLKKSFSKQSKVGSSTSLYSTNSEASNALLASKASGVSNSSTFSRNNSDNQLINNLYLSTLKELEKHEQRLEGEIYQLDQQLASLTPKRIKRPRSAINLGSHNARRSEAMLDFDNEDKINLNLKIKHQIEKHKERLQRTGGRPQSAIIRSKSVDLSKNRSIQASRIEELSKPKSLSTPKSSQKLREFQSAPRIRPHSATSLFAMKHDHSKFHTPKPSNEPKDNSDSNEKKTPMIYVHLKHLLIGEQEIERIQNEIRSQDEVKKQRNLETNQLSTRLFTPQRTSDFREINSDTSTRRVSKLQTLLSGVTPGFDKQYTNHKQELIEQDFDTVSQTESTKSSLQHLVEQKLKALQETMKNISRVETKYQKDVEEITTNLNNSLRQSSNSLNFIKSENEENTSPESFIENNESNLFSMSLDTKEARPILFSFPESDTPIAKEENLESQFSNYENFNIVQNGSRNILRNIIKNSQLSDVKSKNPSNRYSNQKETPEEFTKQLMNELELNPKVPKQQNIYQKSKLNPLLTNTEDKFNPLLSPIHERDAFDQPSDRVQHKPVQRNTPIFQTDSYSNERSRNNIFSGYISNKLIESNSQLNQQPSNEFAKLMLSRQQEANPSKINTTEDLEDSFDAHFERIQTRIRL